MQSDPETVSGAATGVPPPAEVPVTGYTIVLPGGWRRLPVRAGTDKAIKDILDEAFRRVPKGLPRDKVMPYRREFERRLSDMVRKARQKGGVDLYLPVQHVHGMAVPASFVVSQGSLGSAKYAEPAEIIACLGAEGENATQVTVDGAVGVRTERIAAPDPAQEITVGSRRVDYVLAMPGDPDSWLVVAFSTPGDGDPAGEFAGILVELFDAMMSTFRWTME
jgi:hypothetical protein